MRGDDADDHRELGELLRSHRLSARLSQQELSTASGVGLRTIRELENGRAKRPHRQTLVELAAALALTGPDSARLLATGSRRAASTTSVGGSHPPPVEALRPPEAEPAELLGRAAELDALVGIPAGVAVITGQAGIGKSALALHAARRLGPDFPDGLRYVDLRAASSDPPESAPRPAPPAPLLRSLLRSLGVPADAVPRHPVEQLGLYRSVAGQRAGVLVLDNAATEAEVRPLLPGGRWAVLVTSRSPLAGLAQVRRFTLRPLPLPHAERILTRGLGAHARSAAVVELAELCAGVPLLLRAAGQLASGDGEGEGGVEGAIARLRAEPASLDPVSSVDPTLRPSLAAAYDRLPPSARVLFRRLTLLRLPEYSPAVAAALAGTGEPDAEDALDLLADVGLVELPDDTGRYALPELARRFASELAFAEVDPAHAAVAVSLAQAVLGVDRQAS